jgi:hypothetical protein
MSFPLSPFSPLFLNLGFVAQKYLNKSNFFTKEYFIGGEIKDRNKKTQFYKQRKNIV